MSTGELLENRREKLGLTYKQIQLSLGCDEKTLRNYFNGTTKGGLYLTLLLELLDISTQEWNLVLKQSLY